MDQQIPRMAKMSYHKSWKLDVCTNAVIDSDERVSKTLKQMTAIIDLFTLTSVPYKTLIRHILYRTAQNFRMHTSLYIWYSFVSFLSSPHFCPVACGKLSVSYEAHNYKTLKKVCIAASQSHSYATLLAIWDHTVLPATRHKWTCPALTPTSKLVLNLLTTEWWKAEMS